MNIVSLPFMSTENKTKYMQTVTKRRVDTLLSNTENIKQLHSIIHCDFETTSENNQTQL